VTTTFNDLRELKDTRYDELGEDELNKVTGGRKAGGSTGTAGKEFLTIKLTDSL
jgi:bacteriocin-like protein